MEIRNIGKNETCFLGKTPNKALYIPEEGEAFTKKIIKDKSLYK